MTPNPTPTTLREILEPWIGFIHSEYDGTNLLEQELSVVDQATQSIEALINELIIEARIKLIKSIRDDVLEIYEIVAETDREMSFMQVIGKVDTKLSDRLSELQASLYIDKVKDVRYNKDTKTEGTPVKIEVKYVPSEYCARTGWDGKKFFILRWIKGKW